MSWILIANRAGARIVDKQGPQLSLLETISHETGRLRDGELKSDRHGRGFSGVGGTHALSNEESPHEHEAKVFAQELAGKLRSEHVQQRFDRLVLVAEPQFLGILRDALDEPTARTVIASVSKDLSDVPIKDLSAHLPELPQAVL